MEISWHDISTGAMAAAVSVGSAASAIGGGAVTAVSTAAAQVGTAAGAAAGAAANLVPAAVPAAIHAGAVGTAQVAKDLALIEKPIAAAARGVQRSGMLVRAAGVLSRTLPYVAIGASSLSGASIVQRQGVDALFTSKQGRSAVLGAVGGALLLVPTPVTQVAAAVTLGTLAVNEFGGMDRIDEAAGARLNA
jgi:hypothetical protein